MSPRAAPFYCPYCGEEDIVPDGEQAGRFGCRDCARVFQLRYVGLRRAPAAGGAATDRGTVGGGGPTGRPGSSG